MDDGLDTVGHHLFIKAMGVLHHLFEFVVLLDGQGKVSGDDPFHTVLLRHVSSKLQDFSSEVLQDSSNIDWCTSSDSLRILLCAQDSSDTANRESESGST